MTRSLAGVVDALTVLAGLVLAYAGVNALVFAVNPRKFHVISASFILSLSAVLLVLVVYLTAAWALTGRTYGDQLMGLRVVGRHGQRLGLPLALARAVLCVVFPLGLLWCAVSATRRSLQDLLLGTSVIYDWTLRPARVQTS
ncbi:MAG: RDD family protein [Propionibacteriaceae bacterium]